MVLRAISTRPRNTERPSSEGSTRVAYQLQELLKQPLGEYSNAFDCCRTAAQVMGAKTPSTRTKTCGKVSFDSVIIARWATSRESRKSIYPCGDRRDLGGVRGYVYKTAVNESLYQPEAVKFLSGSQTTMFLPDLLFMLPVRRCWPATCWCYALQVQIYNTDERQALEAQRFAIGLKHNLSFVTVQGKRRRGCLSCLLMSLRIVSPGFAMHVNCGIRNHSHCQRIGFVTRVILYCSFWILYARFHCSCVGRLLSS